jgi:UDP-N-acetylmuramoyl-L-alanyl-D-glutamate--2,6-diaminopimelate ligase
MKLRDLLPGVALDAALRDLDIAGVSADSRAIGDGFAFFAIPGHKADGLGFVADAKARGARVVVAERAGVCDLPLVVVPDVRAAVAHAAAKMFPGQP